MASFTERATLEVKDKSTAQIKKINAELKKLQATAKSLKSIKIEIKGIPAARQQVQGLTKDLIKLKNAAKNIKINVQGGAGLTKISNQISNLKNKAKGPINVRVNYTANRPPPIPHQGGGGGGGRGRGANNAGRGGRGRTVLGTLAQGANAGAGGGMGLGLMGGLAAVNPAMMAVAGAAYAAAAALKQIGSQAIKADRADLLLKLAATPDQQKIIQGAVDKYASETNHPLKLDKAELKTFIVGMLGDVGGKTPTERATAAAAIAPQIIDTFLPLSYAMNPNATREESMSGLNTIVKGLNIATGDLTKTVNGVTSLTKDGERVFEGVALAKAMNPQLDAERIRTTLANLKTAAYTMSTESLARLLSTSGDRGVRVANEMFMAIRSLSGVVDNKALNKSLAKMDLLQGGKPLPGKAGKAGGIEPGSGTPVQAERLRTDPYGWIMDHVVPKAIEAAKKGMTAQEKKDTAERVQKVIDEGGDAEDIAQARMPVRAKLQTMLDQIFPGMPGSARTGLAETIYGDIQNRSATAQGKDTVANLRERGQQIFANSLAVQLGNLGTTLNTLSQDLGQAASEKMGLPGMIKSVTDYLANPENREKANTEAINAILKKAQEPLKLTDNPFMLAAKIMVEAGKLLYQGANWIANLFGKGDKSDPNKAAALPDPTRTPLQKAIDNVAEAELPRLMKGIEERIARQTQSYDKAPKGKAGDVRRENIRQSIIKLDEELAAIQSKMAEITKRVEDEKKAAEEKSAAAAAAAKAEQEQKDKEPKPSGTGDRSETTTTDVQTMLAGIQEVPGQFETAFGILPQKGTEGGTNFSTNSMTAITSGAPGAGTALGNAAVAAIKAGVQGLSINVNANVKTAESKGDTGARTAVG